MIFRDVFTEVFSFQIVVAGAVFLAVLLVLGYALARGRRRAEDKRRRNSHPVAELGFAALLAAATAVIVYIGLSANDRLREETGVRAARHASTHIDVTAFQWCWRFDYAQPERSVTAVCDEGDRDVPTLVVPTGEPVELRLTSADVIHALWVPDLGVKADAFPDHTNSLTLTFDEEGRWLGRCAEFCGAHHRSMHFYVRAVSPGEYQQWLQQGSPA